MRKTITFSFASAEFAGTEAAETFTFEELGINENMDGKQLETEIDRIYQAWVWNALNISSSIVIEDIE